MRAAEQLSAMEGGIEFADLDVVEEDVQFTLPRELQALRQEKKAAAASS